MSTQPNTPIVNAGLMYVNGLNASRFANRITAIAAGAARDSTNINDIIALETIFVDGDKNGAGGLDSGVIAVNSFYAIYVIADSKGYQPTTGYMSLDFASPVLPFGYDMFRRVGVIRTGASANIVPFDQYGTDQKRTIYYDSLSTAVLSAGNAIVYSLVGLSVAVPPIDCEVLLQYSFTAAAAANGFQLQRGAYSGVSQGIVSFTPGVASAAIVGMTWCPSNVVSGSSSIQYRVTAAGDALTLRVSGFNDYI